jgi:glyoxylase-like metal-dependent hydrolase (beta-lactamase superfamily II)
MERAVVRIKGGLKEQVAFFLVEHRGVLSLIDTGTHGSAKRALAAIEKAGHKPEDVRQIVLTHCHGDHTGEAKALREATGAIVIAGAEDVPPIEGKAPYPGPVGRISNRVFANLSKFARLPVDHGVTDREHLEGGLVALPSPGHTAGHIAVQAPDLDSIFVGDLVWHLGPVRPSWEPLTQDVARNAESIREIAALGVDKVVVAHGSPITGDRLKDLAKKVRAKKAPRSSDHP